MGGEYTGGTAERNLWKETKREREREKNTHPGDHQTLRERNLRRLRHNYFLHQVLFLFLCSSSTFSFFGAISSLLSYLGSCGGPPIYVRRPFQSPMLQSARHSLCGATAQFLPECCFLKKRTKNKKTKRNFVNK